MTASSSRMESFAGTDLPATNWYCDPTVRASHTSGTGLSDSLPSEHNFGYTHTLIFLTHLGSASDHVLLALKLRGFGAGTYNGVGGKVSSSETARACVLRETLEETGLQLDPHHVKFAGRVRIDVGSGEKVNIALYTAQLERMETEQALRSDEVEARWYDVRDVMGQTRGEGEWKGKMRPEHQIYLAALLDYSMSQKQARRQGPEEQDRQARGQVLLDVNVRFDPEPSKDELEEGERPENHRTVRQWSLDVFHFHSLLDSHRPPHTDRSAH